MVEYWNMTALGSDTGWMDLNKTLSIMTNYWWGYTILIILFIVPLMILLQRGESTYDAFNLSSLYASIGALLLYVGGFFSTNPFIVYFASMIFVITIGIRWYHTR